MYRGFYNLKRNPFEITPDPSFLFATRKHNEALAALYYGVQRRKGFVVLTGEVGTGKTLLIRCLLKLLNHSNVDYAYVFSSRLVPTEFLQFIAGDFGLATSGKNKSELLLDLSSFVISRHEKKLTTVLVVDEAHHLSADVLEEIRLLTNLETAHDKLLQILLVGQPELDEKLDSNELRQLKQRIVLRSQLSPLDLNDTTGYICRRLQLAGGRHPDVLFPKDTVSEIHRYSRGIPRLINTLCENALIHGYAKQLQTVTPDIIQEIAQELRLKAVRPAAPGDGANGGALPGVEEAARTLLELHTRLRGGAVARDSRGRGQRGT
ncbi:MAG: AAA family ATPase [Acidobacteria bacterium]|nr:AAA family ATPase [Acidobacteriota bacterium]